jgi:ketosteroid isomerase-like protein
MTQLKTAARRLAETYWAREMANDIDGVMACYKPDALLVLPDGSELWGSHEIRAFYETAAKAFPRREVEIVDQIDGLDGRTVLSWTAVLYDIENRAYLLQGFNIVTVTDGKFAVLRAAYPSPRPR